MFQTKIINDMNAKYLLITSDEIAVSGYENKMFEYNAIKGFLPFSISCINNNVTYQYKIMNYENLKGLFFNRTFEMEDMKKIFSSIISVGQRAMEYLLDMDAILLNPEYIFLNDEEFLFCYFPGVGQSFYKGIRQLMEYILERLNHNNQETVMLAYGLYQKILKNNFTMENLMEEFVKSEEKPLQKLTFLPDDVKTLPDKTLKAEKEDTKEQEEKIWEEKEADIEKLEEELEKKPVKKTLKNKKKKSLKNFFEWKNTIKPRWETSHNTVLLAEENPYGATRLLNGKMLMNQGNGKDILLTDLPIHVGNMSGDAECKIDNIMVSRNHAVLTMECGIYYVEDNDSTNGTFVNGSRIPPYEPIQIKEGDMVCFANEKYCLN
ncbi:MAG: DUF6382 domain-containing protein [Thermoflexaceae bacterium]|nr:DUF6382 domain-containing protein [Thermoflexaceae bacterium]